MTILDELTDEQITRLEDGEEITVAVELREPLPGRTVSSFNAIQIQMTTQGTMRDLDDKEELLDEFPDVIGLESLLEDE